MVGRYVNCGLAVWWARGRRVIVGIVALMCWCVMALLIEGGFDRLRRVATQCRLFVSRGSEEWMCKRQVWLHCWDRQSARL